MRLYQHNAKHILPNVLGDITLFMRGARLPLARKQFVFAQKDHGNKPPFVGFVEYVRRRWCTTNAFSHVKTTMFFVASARWRLLLRGFCSITRRNNIWNTSLFSINITRRQSDRHTHKHTHMY